MTPEQKEAYRREVLEEAAKVADEHIPRLPHDGPSNAFDEGAYFMSADIAAAIRALAASQPAPAVDTGQAVGFCAPETIEKLLSGKAANGADISCMKGNAYTVPLYTHPAPLDAERVREAWAYRVHDFHIARSPVKARAKFPEATEYFYPASRHADAIEMARFLGGTCTPLYPPEDAR